MASGTVVTAVAPAGDGFRYLGVEVRVGPVAGARDRTPLSGIPGVEGVGVALEAAGRVQCFTSLVDREFGGTKGGGAVRSRVLQYLWSTGNVVPY